MEVSAGTPIYTQQLSADYRTALHLEEVDASATLFQAGTEANSPVSDGDLPEASRSHVASKLPPDDPLLSRPSVWSLTCMVNDKSNVAFFCRSWLGFSGMVPSASLNNFVPAPFKPPDL